MSLELTPKTANFIIWYRKHTTHIQDNVVFYKGKHYFMDKQTINSEVDGAINDLWKVYISEVWGD